MKELVFNELNKLEEKYINVWKEFSEIESPSNFKEGVDKASGYIAEIAKSIGYVIEKFEHPVSGDVVCITMNSESTEKPIVLSGHVDTVHPVGSYGSPAVKMDSEKIYGPGVTDCKGGIVSSLYAMEALLKCGYKKRPVKLLLQSDEEVGSSLSEKATINYICEKSKDAVAFLNMEGTKIPHICIERKGIANFLFEIEGVEAHSSKCATEGTNAVLEAAYKLVEIEKIKDADGITCCTSLIKGGSALNTVPGKCEFNVNVRYSTKEQYEEIKQILQEIANKEFLPGTKCTLTQKTYRISMEICDKNMNLYKKVCEIFKKWELPVLSIEKHTGGSDASEVTAQGIPCIDSLGVSGGGIHSPNEFGYLASLKDSAKRVISIICEL